MIRVLVTGIGGSIGIDIARSLRSFEAYYLIGSDKSWSGLQWGSRFCHETLELPSATEDADAFATAFSEAVEQLEIDYAFVNPDSELSALANAGWPVPCRGSAPPRDVLSVCLDKGATVDVVGDSSTCPVTRRVRQESDLVSAFETLGRPLWLRPATGAGGRRSFVANTVDEARFWIRYWEDRKEHHAWLLQEFLPGRNMNWSGVYTGGTLVCSAAMERLKYFLEEVTPTGITGQVARCATIEQDNILNVADGVVRQIMPVPDGIFSVDFREDATGRPRVTEVNPRLAGRPWLYTQAGANLPAAAVGVGDTATAHLHAAVGVEMFRQLDLDPVVRWP